MKNKVYAANLRQSTPRQETTPLEYAINLVHMLSLDPTASVESLALKLDQPVIFLQEKLSVLWKSNFRQ